MIGLNKFISRMDVDGKLLDIPVLLEPTNRVPLIVTHHMVITTQPDFFELSFYDGTPPLITSDTDNQIVAQLKAEGYSQPALPVSLFQLRALMILPQPLPKRRD
jgi:hypothetical protein